jgi:glycosyltransferase involved in cell wall biosynthesis
VANNPRLVKEADALAKAGYDVDVVACQYVDWATEHDQPILERADWTPHLLRWGRNESPFLFWHSRLRQHACRKLLELPGAGPSLRGNESLLLRAFDRVLPELYTETQQPPADLYIAHNLQALPVAAAAARKHGAKLGFDAEDFHSGMRGYDAEPGLRDEIVERLEGTYLPQCDYLTAASPGIAEAYANKYGVDEPTSILNVFPLRHRPDAHQSTDPDGPLTLYWFSQTIGPERGLEDVVRALSHLSGENIELHLRGNWHSPEYRDKLHRLAGPTADRLISHEPAPPDEMVTRAAKYDVGLALEQDVEKNRDICLTNKIFTYLLAGNAVVATATSAQRRLMEKIDDTGFLYEPGDDSALARHLTTWIQDREALGRCRNHAWKHGGETYNWNTEKDKFLAIVDDVLSP